MNIMQLLKATLTIILAAIVVGCTFVRHQDIDAWVGVPVEALDTHSYFKTVQMYRKITGSGIEIRNYVNGKVGDVAKCWRLSGGGKSGRYVNKFTACPDRLIVCNNIFHIREGKVIEYAPTGQCLTNETVQPQAHYLRLKEQ